MALLAGCTTAARPPSYRSSTAEEVRVAQTAVWPLLEELGYPLPGPPANADTCKIGLTVTLTPRITASIQPGGTTTPCTYFTLRVSDGALRRLSVAQLRAVFAHELGHIELRHHEARKNGQEADADRFAVALLKRLEPRYPGSCLALVSVLRLLAEEQRGRASPWFDTHPSPERRAETVLAGCTSGNSCAADGHADGCHVADALARNDVSVHKISPR